MQVSNHFTPQTAFAFPNALEIPSMENSRSTVSSYPRAEMRASLRAGKSRGWVNNLAVKPKSLSADAGDAPPATHANARQGKLDLPAPSPATQTQKLRNRALRMLTTREHSREELMRKLAQAKARNARRFNEPQDRDAERTAKDDIEALVDQLAAQGWQSDERYAEALVRRLGGQASRRYIADKLAQVGIKKEVAANAIESLEQDDRDVAQTLWNRRFGEPPKTDKERQRQIRFLLSRGFHLSDAFRIVPRTNVNSEVPEE